jgi:hypothetical protein
MNEAQQAVVEAVKQAMANESAWRERSDSGWNH